MLATSPTTNTTVGASRVKPSVLAREVAQTAARTPERMRTTQYTVTPGDALLSLSGYGAARPGVLVADPPSPSHTVRRPAVLIGQDVEGAGVVPRRPDDLGGLVDDEGGLAVGAAAVVGGDHPAVGGGIGVPASTHPLPQGAGQGQVEAAGRARAGCLPGHRRAGPDPPGGPAAARLGAALGGHDPLAAQPEFLGDDPALRVVGRVVRHEVGRDQARVVLGGRGGVADRAGAGPGA